MFLRIKFRVTKFATTANGEKEVTLLVMHDKTIREDLRIARERPYGSIQFTLDNPAVAHFFKPGKYVYVEISDAPA